MKKVLNFIKTLVITILAIVFFSFAIAMTVLLLNFNQYGVTQFGDTSLLLIKEEVSTDNYKKGDLVIVEAKKISRITPGDELFVYKITENKKVVNIDVGIVGQTHPEDNEVTFVNGETYDMKFVVGKASKVYEKIGGYLAIVESKWGFLFIVLVPSFMIFIYQLYSLIIEIKYGREEEYYN